MAPYNWKKDYAIKKQYLESIGYEIPEVPGIYLWTRFDPEINKTYFYVGQAKNLRNRRWDYYKIQTGLAWPTRHFEASLKAHNDWKYQIIEQCKEEELDAKEKAWILEYMKKDNHITRNDSLTGDSSRVTKRDIEKIRAEYKKAFSKIFKQLDFIEGCGSVQISIRRNKDGKTFSKKSIDAYETLCKKIKEIMDENIEGN